MPYRYGTSSIRSRCHTSIRHFASHLRPLLTLGGDLQVPPDQARAVLHHAQTHSALGSGSGLQTHTIVVDPQQQSVGPGFQADLNRSRLAVPDGVVNRLLNYPVQGKADLRIEVQLGLRTFELATHIKKPPGLI